MIIEIVREIDESTYQRYLDEVGRIPEYLSVRVLSKQEWPDKAPSAYKSVRGK